MKKRIVLALGLVAAPASLLASEHFWIIGGGPRPEASQAQIEFNVDWVVTSLREMVPDAVIHVFYANGTGPEPATVELLTEPDAEAHDFEALARVFGAPDAVRVRYREHRVENVEGSTRADALVPELGRQLAALEPGDQGMIIYNGHGSWAPDHAGNALRLWGETALDVREFEGLLSRVDSAVPVRFLFTQCYSGAFERAVHPGAADVLALAPGRRCGFFAESEDRESEGCSASIDIGDYRDYTTYFFAALTGTTRIGEPVDPQDWDGDGVITPFDAHLFALVEGRNADLPRSTSEVYLERWLPWYARWLGTDRIPENLYGRAARQLARDNGLAESEAELGRALESRYREVVDRIAELTASQMERDQAAAALEAELQARVTERWPSLSHPYTAAFRESVSTDMVAIDAFIVAQPEYEELVRAQEGVRSLEIEVMEADRELSQLEKIRRTRVLARALDQLERHGSESDLAAYGRLRSCEALPLGS